MNIPSQSSQAEQLLKDTNKTPITSPQHKMIFYASLWKSRLVFWFGALNVGCLAALFALASEWANNRFHLFVNQSIWLPLIICPLGMVLISWLTKNFFVGAEGSGIPQSIAAIHLHDSTQRQHLLSLRIAFGKILLTVLGLLSGASIGREGPTVHVGASIMNSLGRFAKFPRYDVERGLILAGSAAGIAAAFNTPIAGIIFAVEEMNHSFEERSSGTLLIAVIIAGVAAQMIEGNYTYFGYTSAALRARHWALIPLSGVVGGLFGGGVAKTLVAFSLRLRPYITQHPFRLAFACGISLALLGVLSDSTIYGTGYYETKSMLIGDAHTDIYYPFYKIFATIISYLSGIPGGIFAPSLAIGAGLGANLAHWFPSAPVAATVILGMVSFLSGIVQAPITAFIIVMEMTDNRTMLFPLMIASLISFAISRLICPEPIYRLLAKNFR